MTMRLVSSVFAIALLSGWAAASPAAPQSASLSGVVVDDLGRPVRLAIVSLRAGSLPQDLAAVSDDDGRFAFAGLPDGTFTVTVAKKAYVSNAFGAARPGGRGTPIVLVEGQRRDDVRLMLPRGAVITGVVTDPFGHPLPGAEVAALPAAAARVRGEFLLRPATVRTDDRGVYRIFGLAPGEYLVSASLGRRGPDRMEAPDAPSLDAEFDALRRRTSAVGVLPSRPAAAAAPHRPTQPVDFVPTFHPGTIAVENAARLALAPGDERAGIDIPMAMVPTATIAGVVVTQDGSPLPAVQVGLGSIGPLLSFLPGQLGDGELDARGQFEYGNLPPGQYTVTARARGGRRGAAPAPTYARAVISLNGADETGLVLTLEPGRSFAGRISFDASGGEPPDSVRRMSASLVSESYLAAATVSGGAVAIPSVSPTAAIRPDGEGDFTVSGLEPGRYLLGSQAPAASGWWLRSAMSGGRDLLDTGIDLEEKDLTGVLILFTNRHSELSGVLETANGAPAPGYFLVVIPADRSLWRPGARRIRFVRPDSSGAYAFTDLPGGEYHLAAAADLTREQLDRAEFLEALVAGSTPVTVRDGERTVQHLRIGRER